MGYIDQAYGNEYKEVASILGAGMILPRFIPYLVKLGDVLVCQRNQGHTACLAVSEPIRFQSGTMLSSDNGPTTVDGTVGLGYPFTEAAGSKHEAEDWEIDTQAWKLDGYFRKHSEKMVFKVPEPRPAGGLIPIKELNLYPIRYESPRFWSRLRARGLQVWKSRARRYVDYRANPNDISMERSDSRYMIDPLAYRKLQKSDESDPRDDLGSTNTTPADPFLVLLPTMIQGFNTRTQKWEELEVDRIADVSWNKEAFENLVLDDQLKHLVKALVSSPPVQDRRGDFIARKGKDTIILLHGAPGTGKTLTAEGVAEVAEKRLLPVTYGELGTDPAEFKRALEQIYILVSCGTASSCLKAPTPTPGGNR